ncbi:MAG: chemotaxis protein CheX [Thermodesulfobacteriota bacterium]
MDNRMRNLLSETAAQVFETMYYIFFSRLHSLPADLDWATRHRYVKAVVSFTGKGGGALTLFMPVPLARMVTTNFLGIDRSEVSEQQIQDTCREAANMVGGGFLGQIDPEGEYVLGIPVVTPVADILQEPAVDDRDHQCVFKTEHGLLIIHLAMPEG